MEKKQDKTTLKIISLLKKFENEVSRGKLISEIVLTDEEKINIREYQFLTAKPVFFVLNANGKIQYTLSKGQYLTMNLKDEEEISELTEVEKKELEMQSQLDLLIKACYNILNLITFFTVAGGKETRAWTIVRGSRAPQAGGVVHSDFEKKFIRAEVIPWNLLVESGSWSRAREKGQLQIVGRDYEVKDGDVIEFRI